MTLSPNGLNFIKANESLVLHPYLDDAGVPTIGYGTTVYPSGRHVSMGDNHIATIDAEGYLQHDTVIFVNSLNDILSGIVLNQNQFDALVDFTYEEGARAFKGSTLLKRIKANPFDTTIKEAFHMWNKITVDGQLVFSQGVDNRRSKDVALYFAPIS